MISPHDREEITMKKVKIWDLLIFILSAELAGAVSSLISGGDFGTYYASLTKPPLAPPGWLFPVMWTILYALMGFAAYMINNTADKLAAKALILYWVQLAVNVLWSPVFFGLRSFGGAAVIVVLMLALVTATLVIFSRIQKCAAAAFIPYLVWTAFAAYLTFGFLVLNG